MTKEREPLSFDAALATIAGKVPGHWKTLAEIADRDDSTVRSWGDENRDGELPVKFAILFDLAYQEAGGIGRPIYDTYSRLLGVATAERYVDAFCIMRMTADALKEVGDAKAALLRALLPDATARDIDRAQSELIQAIDKMNAIVLTLEAGPQATTAQDHIRGPP